MIYHLLPTAEWLAAPPSGPCRPAGLAREGFVHCTRGVDLLHRVERTVFADRPGEVTVLYIDESRLRAPVREVRSPAGNVFPHVHGPIDREAIVAARPMREVPGLGRVFPGQVTPFAASDDLDPRPVEPDLFGEVLREAAAGGDGRHALRREDGYLDEDEGRVYVEEVGTGLPLEREALAGVGGRVLDLGAGAGRVALLLQARGAEVTAIDLSPGAIDVMRRRGVHRPLLADAHAFAAPPSSFDAPFFDAAVLFGCNLGLGGTTLGLEVLLSRLARLLRPGGRLVANEIEVLSTDRPEHLAFHARNRALGRAPGEMWLRVERGDRRGPWFPWYVVGSAEAASAAEQAGFAVEHILRADAGPTYALLATRR